MIIQKELKFVTIKGPSEEARVTEQLNNLLDEGFQMISHQPFGGGAMQFFIFAKLEDDEREGE